MINLIMKKILLCLSFLCTISISIILSTSTVKAAGFTGVKCKYSYKTDYFSLNYTNCAYRCDNYVNGVSTRMSNGNYAYYVNKKIFAGQTCPLGRDD